MTNTQVRVLAAVGCLVASVWMLGIARQERRLTSAGEALSAGQTQRATRLAASADGETVAARAARTLAAASLLEGKLPEAARQLARATRSSPNDWGLHRDRAVVLRRLGDASGARREIRRALSLNPGLDLPPGFVARRRTAPSG